MVKPITVLLAACAVSILITGDSQAIQGVPGVSLTGAFSYTQSSFPDTTDISGFEFTPTADIKITALGYYGTDLYGGLLSDIDVSIFETDTKQLLTTVTLESGPGGTLINNHWYTSITPCSLTGGVKYDIVAFYRGQSESLHRIEAPLGSSPLIGDVRTYFDFEIGTYTGPHYPLQRRLFSNVDLLSGPNFLFTVPEPSAFVVAVMSQLGLLLCGRQRIQ